MFLSNLKKTALEALKAITYVLALFAFLFVSVAILEYIGPVSYIAFWLLSIFGLRLWSNAKLDELNADLRAMNEEK